MTDEDYDAAEMLKRLERQVTDLQNTRSGDETPSILQSISDSADLGDSIGLFDYSLDFDGTDDYIEAPFTDPGQQLSFGARFNSDQSSGSGVLVFGTSQQDGGGHQWGLFINSGNVKFSIWTDESGQQNFHNEPLDPGVTHTYLATYDGSVARAYVDGVEVSSQTLNETVTTGVNYVHIGGRTPNDWYTDGQIDDPVVYDRGISADEAIDYENHVIPDSPMGYWPFINGSGTVVTDTAGSNDGEFRGDPQWISPLSAESSGFTWSADAWSMNSW